MTKLGLKERRMSETGRVLFALTYMHTHRVCRSNGLRMNLMMIDYHVFMVSNGDYVVMSPGHKSYLLVVID